MDPFQSLELLGAPADNAEEPDEDLEKKMSDFRAHYRQKEDKREKHLSAVKRQSEDKLIKEGNQRNRGLTSTERNILWELFKDAERTGTGQKVVVSRIA